MNRIIFTFFLLLAGSLSAKTITLTVPGKKLSITIDYTNGCSITQLIVNGKNTLSTAGVYTAVGALTSLQAKNIKVTELKNKVILSNITYGGITEVWDFKVTGDKITWDISRSYNQNMVLEETAFPAWNFSDMNTWKGGIFDNGGMVWCKYLHNINDTYGVHTGGVTFWNANSGDALRISATGNNIAAKYTHNTSDVFTCTHSVTSQPVKPRYNLNRFVAGKSDVFAPVNENKGTVKAHFELQYVDYFQSYSRGTLPGTDADAIRELLNTTGRYGVVDNTIVGGNGWLTNWKCLHEPFFAGIGLAVNDPNYTKNLSSTLDRERDVAMLDNGRVLSRWHNEAGDEIPGTYNAETGYYEAMWGYTIDSQTGYIINTSEQFNQTGDVKWLKSHQQSCEKALDWLIKRDSNHNGIYEMMNNSIADKKASDWLDIVWASFENAFVNAQLYKGLISWSHCETILGNKQKAGYYTAIAARLKTAFNKPIEEGGFWDESQKQYVYWRDNDNSIHGNNLVTPVNFAAITFGLCDDEKRIATILGNIEQRMQKEQLFHWPLCFDSFKKEEVQEGNWPFPRYENGDIFPSWGYLGIGAYARYDKAIALKYISNLLEQYKKDGLSSQRYSRVTQKGLGEDILAGICTSMIALYTDIYGIHPEWNRLGLMPNLSESLNGTKFSYQFRDTVYNLELSVNNYRMSTRSFSIKSAEGFGANKTGDLLTFYPHNEDSTTLQISGKRIDLEVINAHSWKIISKGQHKITLTGLKADKDYLISINSKTQRIHANKEGRLSFESGPATVAYGPI
jgi:hypothetical protein